jgi:serine/threonine-protein kinase
MRTLAALGDRAGAIQYAQVHARVLREELELEPDVEVTELAEELRSAPRRMQSRSGTTDRRGVVEATEILTVAQPADAGAVGAAHVPARLAARGFAGRRGEADRERVTAWRRWYLAPAVIGVVGVVVFVLLGRGDSAQMRVAPLEQRVVVAPFRVSGADSSLGYLREGIVELLSTRLADDTAARSVDVGAVISAWQLAGITGATDAPRDTMVRLAAQLGAERVIVGSVVGTPARAILSAAVIEVSSGRVSAEATVHGPADSLATLVDRLAGKLLLLEAGQDQWLADRMTASLPALRAYLAAIPAQARGDYALAAKEYARALESDSTFALAALRLALVAGRLNDFELQRRALHRAWRFRAELSERDRAHLAGLTGPRYPAPSSVGETLTAWETAVRVAPNRADVWYEFGARMAETSPLVGLENVYERVTASLHRALELDASHAAAMLLLERMTANVGIAFPWQSGSTDGAPGDSTQPLGPFLRWRSAAARGDSAELTRLADSVPHLGPANLRALAAASQFDGLRPRDGQRALETLLARAATSDQAMDLLLAEHSLALNLGRPTAALDVTRRLQRLSPATRAHLRLRVLDAVFSEVDSALAAVGARAIESTAGSSSPASARADACTLAEWHLARGDTAAARSAVEPLSDVHEYEPVPVSTPAALCARLVVAALAVGAGRADAHARMAALDSLVLTTAAVGDAAAYAHIAISRLYRRLGEPHRALAAIRRRPYMAAAWPRYLATALREEGDLAREVGDVPGALAAYRQYLALRSNPEERLAVSVRSVLDHVQDLEGRLQ